MEEIKSGQKFCRYPEHCGDHEDNVRTINTLNGESRVGKWLVLAVLTALAVQGFSNGIRISSYKENTVSQLISLEKSIMVGDQAVMARVFLDITRLENNDISIERSINTININLRRFMEAQGVSYIDPNHVISPRRGGS